jgi:transposase
LELCRHRHNSKERRIDPQIVVGLLVDRTGFPLQIGCFEGNTAQTTTLVPIITAFADRHDLTDTPMVIAADAGMLSASNLAALDEAGLQCEGADRSRIAFPLER